MIILKGKNETRLKLFDALIENMEQEIARQALITPLRAVLMMKIKLLELKIERLEFLNQILVEKLGI